MFCGRVNWAFVAFSCAEGLVRALWEGMEAGEIPRDLKVKVSGMMGLSNPMAAKTLEDYGVSSFNISSGFGSGEIAAFRALLDGSIDFYVESPDGLGGMLRYHDVPEVVRVGAPVYLKFGLRNVPNIYPWSEAVKEVAVLEAKERVRRAAIVCERFSDDLGAG